ncbi:hypothetical protein GGR95_003327 [Sulfitobacter undariae]|uniref:Immunity MXAN-0049 protein domain-containing protein n=1 Tax=Sulfitobacter undariae TaxID=1563671 RepID=A0A7W6E6K6_9RHOB|nr:DUF1629 domain-containing protein [Sulfitobacter undariae]MBB3995665.1 hypothetical protein [Sulfitobacter undariae]
MSAADRKRSPEHLPQKLQFEKGKKLPDFMTSFPGCNNIFTSSKLVSSRLKELIEHHRSEEDDWEFYPVDILHKDGTLYATYYVWCVTTTLDGIDETSEGIKSVGGPIDGNHLWQEFGELSPARLKVRKLIVGGLNAWIDFRFHATMDYFISDALFQAMSDAKMTGFDAQSFWSEV